MADKKGGGQNPSPFFFAQTNTRDDVGFICRRGSGTTKAHS